MPAQNINDHYSADHEELAALFRRFQNLRDTDRPGALEAFRGFKAGLERHILWEERLLFPLYDQELGHLKNGPLPILRREHQQIQLYLGEISAKLAQDDFQTAAEEKLLDMVLRRHNQKEEEDLYPTMDKILTDPQRAAVFAAMAKRR